MRKASVSAAQSIRFDRNDSPNYINDGKGWTQPLAADWLNRHELAATFDNDDNYLRAKCRDSGRFTDMHQVDVGVEMIRCESSE